MKKRDGLLVAVGLIAAGSVFLFQFVKSPPQAAPPAAEERKRDSGTADGSSDMESKTARVGASLEASFRKRFSEVVNKDPLAAWKQALESGDPEAARGMVEMILALSTKEGLRAILEQHEGSNSEFARFSRQLLLKRLAALDPFLGLEVARTHFDGLHRNAGITHALAELSLSNRAAALAEIKKLQDPALRDQALAGVFEKLCASDKSGASTLSALREIDPGSAAKLLGSKSNVVEIVATKDPNLLKEILSKLPLTNSLGPVTSKIVAQVVNIDPRLAISIIAGADYDIPAAMLERSLDIAAAKLAGQKDGTEYLTRLLRESSGNSTTSLAKTLGMLLATKPADQRDLAIKALSPEQQSVAASAYLSTYSSASALVPLAKKMVAGDDPMFQLLDESKQKELVNHISSFPASPTETIEWIQTLKNKDLRVAGYSALISRWVEQDSSGATKWLENLPPGQEKDAVIASFATNLERVDPEGAQQWRELIGK